MQIKNTVLTQFEEQVERYPDNVAVIDQKQVLTYRQLNQQANGLAAQLISSLKFPGQLVGLCISRSPAFIVGMLGILKAGGAYVPIDPDYPTARINFLLQDSQVSVVVSTASDVASLQAEQVHCPTVVLVDQQQEALAKPTKHQITPKTIAYMIYTSGSTGTPKGVLVAHEQLTHLFEATQDTFQFNATDVWTLCHSPSFDFSVWEIWGALLYGGKVLIVPTDWAQSPGLLAKLLLQHEVTVLNLTPTAFDQLARWSIQNENLYSTLRWLILGGERLSLSLLAPWIKQYGDQQPRLVNMYGITEITVHATYRLLTKEDLQQPDLSPIGQPIPGMHIFLRSPDGELVVPGTVGEIWLSGPGVTVGYWQQPELTASRFPEEPLGSQGELVRCYRSGDLAYWLGDDLIYQGRCDEQLQVKGYRIEPQEIELQLVACPGIAQVVIGVLDFDQGEQRLLAFFVPQSDEPGDTQNRVQRLSNYATEMLPAHLQPSRFIEVTEMPKTPHGKRDIKALWQQHEALTLDSHPEQAVTGICAQLVTLVQQLFTEDSLKLDQDLFDQGMTSLAFTRLLLAINDQFGVQLTGVELAGNSAINNIAKVIQEQKSLQSKDKSKQQELA